MSKQQSQLSSPVKIGIAGLGTVGQSVVNILRSDTSPLASEIHGNYQITEAVVRNPNASRDCNLDGVQVHSDLLALANSDQVDIIVELIGDVEDSLQLCRAALLKSKPVITANKALLALHGDELFQLAKQQQVPLLFEAAVAGGIPAIKVLRESITANHIDHICGIINGTCNYLLTRMAKEGINYQEVLQDAQRLGYAEADPSFDVEGVDAAHKLTLLVRLAFKQNIKFADIYLQGLSHIHLDDFRYANRLGYVIKPLAVASITDNNTIDCHVNPTLIPKNTIIAKVNDVLNAVVLHGDRFGEITLTGAGAGGDATASAVVSDLVEVLKGISNQTLPFIDNGIAVNQPMGTVTPKEQLQSAFFLRLLALDEPGTLQQLTEQLSQCNISIEAIIQEPPQDTNNIATIAIITNSVQEQVMQDALEKILLHSCFDADNYSLIRLSN